MWIQGGRAGLGGGAGIARRGAFLGEEKPRYIGRPERPGNNERLGRRGNFIALGRSMCAARLRGRSQARRRARRVGLRGRDLSNFRNTRALGVSNQTPPFLYGLYLSRSFFPLAPYFPFRPTPSPFVSTLPPFPALLSSTWHPFHALSCYTSPVPSHLSLSFPLERRFGSANDSRFLNSAATCRQVASPRCGPGRFPEGNTESQKLKIECSRGRALSGLTFIHILRDERSRNSLREVKVTPGSKMFRNQYATRETFVCALFFIPIINNIFPAKRCVARF